MAGEEKGSVAYGRSSYDELLEVLGLALDFRDNDTAGHSRRVAQYSLEIAKAVGCSSDELLQINRGAYLHDLGKIAIPDAILFKRGALTAEEWEVMKTHPWLGYNLLTRISLLAPVGAILLSHHERYDGMGYPQGLKGDEIPVGARIFAIADTMDAMTSDRPYRKGKPYSEARKEIASQSGHQFDPAVVAAFLAIPEETLRGTILREKRRTMRLPLVADVICQIGDKLHKLKSVNICEGGMLLEDAGDLKVGTDLGLDLVLSETGPSLKLTAKAVRRDLPNHVAVAFQFVPPQCREAIQSYITARIAA